MNAIVFVCISITTYMTESQFPISAKTLCPAIKTINSKWHNEELALRIYYGFLKEYKTFPLHLHILQEIETSAKKAKKILAFFTESIFIDCI